MGTRQNTPGGRKNHRSYAEGIFTSLQTLVSGVDQ
jgi:hypothetical protein